MNIDLTHAGIQDAGAPGQRVGAGADGDVPLHWGEFGIAFLFALVVGAAVFVIHRGADPRFLVAPVGNDVWFEADLPAVSQGMLHRWADQSRNTRHPLFPLFVTTTAHGFRTLGLQDRTILQILVSGIAAAWSAVFYILMRLATGRRLDALVFAVLGCVSSAALFWLAVPETYAWGSTTILAAFGLCAFGRTRRVHDAWYVMAAALTLSITTTNWLAGAAAAVARNPWRRAVQILANSLVVVITLWAVQRALYPTADFFIGYANERKFVFGVMGDRAVEVLRALFFHSVVMPDIHVVPEPKWGAMMSVQSSTIGSSGMWGGIAAMLWIGLLALAVRALLTRAIDARLRLAVGLFMAGQTAVHLVYGEETFLYSLNIAPLLIAAAALATRTPQRRLALGLAVALTVTLAVNNVAQLAHALRFFETPGGRPELAVPAKRTARAIQFESKRRMSDGVGVVSGGIPVFGYGLRRSHH